MIKGKTLLINMCVAFTVSTLYSLIASAIEGDMETHNIDLFLRLSLCIIGFGTMVIFNWFNEWPLRFVQALHYVISMLFIILLIVIINLFTQVHSSFYITVMKEFSIAYSITLLIYEIKFRLEIKNKNKLLERL